MVIIPWVFSIQGAFYVFLLTIGGMGSAAFKFACIHQ